VVTLPEVKVRIPETVGLTVLSVMPAELAMVRLLNVVAFVPRWTGSRAVEVRRAGARRECPVVREVATEIISVRPGSERRAGADRKVTSDGESGGGGLGAAKAAKDQVAVSDRGCCSRLALRPAPHRDRRSPCSPVQGQIYERGQWPVPCDVQKAGGRYRDGRGGGRVPECSPVYSHRSIDRHAGFRVETTGTVDGHQSVGTNRNGRTAGVRVDVASAIYGERAVDDDRPELEIRAGVGREGGVLSMVRVTLVADVAVELRVTG